MPPVPELAQSGIPILARYMMDAEIDYVGATRPKPRFALETGQMNCMQKLELAREAKLRFPDGS